MQGRYTSSGARGVTRRAAIGGLAAPAVATAMLGGVRGASAQSGRAAAGDGGVWPTRPVRIIVAFGPGGAADTATRAFGARMSETLGQQIIVENRTGGNSVIAGSATLQSPRDGYTFLVDAAQQLINPLLLNDLPFDYRASFIPVSQLVYFAQVIAVRQDFPAATIEEFVAYARAHPGRITYGTPPAAGMAHMAGEVLMRELGFRMTHAPYRQATDAARDVGAGNLDAVLITTSTIRPIVQAGRARVLAVTSARRVGAYPDAPAIAERLLPGFEMNDWMGLFAASGVPAPIVARMGAAVGEAARDPGVRARLEPLGAELVGSTPEEFAGFLERQRELVTRVIREANIRLG
jgi:tripartite-type tricarboxylate transporter receptor subunit TctC